jgi:hypothetical protein
MGFEPTSTEVAVDTGTTGGEQTTEIQQPEAPAREYLELNDDVANRYVRVTVDGEELDVPLKEALSGYSRQADYTRKTQEAAELRKQAEFGLTLQQALQAQPEETIRLLARQHGLTLAEQQALRDQAQTPAFDEDQYTDPLERKVAFLEHQLTERQQREQQAEADAHLRGAIGGLQTRYQADDATVREVVAQALQLQVGPDAFEMIYKNIMYDRAMQARAAAQQKRAAEDQQRQAAAQRAGQVTGAGPSANGAGAPPPKTTEFKSYREAIEASFDQLGG